MFFGIWKDSFGFLLLSMGLILNYTVVLMNDGKMPVDPLKLKYIMLREGYVFINKNTKLKWLSDCLYFPGSGNIFSIGDVCIWASFLVMAIEYW